MTRRPVRLRLRRRLFIYSAPVVAAALLVAIKLFVVVLAGNSATHAFASGDATAVRRDAAILGVVNVVEPARAPFVAGTAAVLGGRLEDADARFTDAMARSDSVGSCPVRVNLELVRETQGDRAAAAGDRARADERYTSALAIVEAAPQGCFAGNTDPDPQRHAIRDEAANRLAAKRSALSAAPPTAPPPPPPSPPAAPPPPPPPLGSAAIDDGDNPPRRLDPAGGDPLDKLQRVLQDAAGATPPGESP